MKKGTKQYLEQIPGFPSQTENQKIALIIQLIHKIRLIKYSTYIEKRTIHLNIYLNK